MRKKWVLGSNYRWHVPFIVRPLIFVCFYIQLCHLRHHQIIVSFHRLLMLTLTSYNKESRSYQSAPWRWIWWILRSWMLHKSPYSPTNKHQSPSTCRILDPCPREPSVCKANGEHQYRTCTCEMGQFHPSLLFLLSNPMIWGSCG